MSDADPGTDDRDDTRTVIACPECDSTNVWIRGGSINYTRRADDGAYRCNDCKADFDDPTRRPPKHDAAIGAKGLAATLSEMSSDELTTDGGQPTETPADHDRYDVTVVTERKQIVERVEAPNMTQAKVVAEREATPVIDGERVKGAGKALDAPGDLYDVVVTMEREQIVTVTAAHPSEARVKAKRQARIEAGETVAGRPTVDRAPGDRRVD